MNRKKFFRSLLMLVALFMTMSIKSQTQYLLNEGFEGLTSGVPSGWDVSGTAKSSYNWKLYTGDSEHPKCLRFDAYNASKGSTGILKTPSLDLGSSDKILTFDWKFESTKGGKLDVFISLDGGSTFSTTLKTSLNSSKGWVSEELNLAPYSGNANVQIVFHATSDYDYYRIDVDNVVVKSAPTCAKPLNISVVNLTQTTANLMWTLDEVGEIPSAYTLKVSDDNGNEIINNAALSPLGTSTSLTGLLPNTTYRVLLQSDCSSADKGKSDWTNVYTFTTLCNNIVLPIVNNFTSETSHLPACWYSGGGNSENVKLSSAQHFGVEGDKSLSIASTILSDAFIATPQINHSANDMEISFKIYGPKHAKFSVGIANDITDYSTVDLLRNDSLPVDNKWYEYSVNTASSYYGSANNIHVVIYAPSGKNSTIYIDDITITSAPSCVRPQELKVSDISHENAQLSWQSVTGQISNDYEVKLFDGFTEQILSSTSTSLFINNLTHNSNYKARVRQICAVGDTSAWSSAVEFKTYCAPTTLFPILENFEGESFPPSCWSIEQWQNGNGIGDELGLSAWSSYEKTSSWGTTPQEGNRMAEHAQNREGSKVVLSTPYMSVPGVNTHEVRFWMYRDSNFDKEEGISVYVNSQLDSAGATHLGHIPRSRTASPTETSNGWYQYTFPIPVSGNVFVFFAGVSNYSGETYIDNVVIQERPSCLPVLSIQIDSVSPYSAYFSWDTEVGSATSWHVEYKQENDANFVSMDVSEPRLTINGFTPNSLHTYILRVRSDCGEELSEVKEREIEFRTECVPSTFPYTENFERSFSSTRGKCWFFPVRSSSMSPSITSGQMRTTREGLLVSPEFSFSSWKGKRISVDISGNNSPIRVGLMSDPMDTSTFVEIKKVYFDNIAKTYNIDITADYDERHIAFFTKDSVINDVYVTIDNFKLHNITSCAEVNNLAVDSIGETTARLAIIANDNPQWQVKYSPLPFNEINAQTIQISGAYHRLTNLLSDTEYALVVRSYCSQESVGNWSDTAFFRTDCAAYSVSIGNPFLEGFEANQLDQKPINACWSQETVSGTAMWIANSSLTYNNRAPYTGKWNAYLKYSNEAYLIRQLSLKANADYKFTCYARQDKDIQGAMKVSISNTEKKGHDGIIIIDEEPIVSGEYQIFTSYFRVGVDDIYFLKVGGSLGSSPYYISIDDIKVEEVTCAPPHISTISILSLTDNMATLSWNAQANRYAVKISTSNIDPSTEVANVLHDTVDGLTLVVNQLTPNTSYNIYLQSLCSDGEDSEWSEAAHFTTACSSFDLPLIEGFDESDNSFDCWRSITEKKASLNSSYKLNGTHSLQVSDGVTVASPLFNIESLANQQLTAWVYTNSDNAQLSLGVMNDVNDISTYVSIRDIHITKKQTWTEIVVNFAELNDSEYNEWKNAKNLVLTNNGENILYIDKMDISHAPSCPKLTDLSISDISDTAATISWFANREHAWQVKVESKGNIVSSEIITEYPYLIDGLHPNTFYTVYARAICAEGDSSVWNSITFNTLCKIEYSLPYSETFNTLKSGDIHSCLVNSHRSNSNARWTAYSGPLTGTVSYEYDMYTESRDMGEYSMIQTPSVNLEGETAVTLEFDLMNPVAHQLLVLISTDNGLTFNDTIYATTEAIPDLTTQEINLSSYVGQTVVVGFKAIKFRTIEEGDTYMRIDNINMFVPSSCVRPISIDICNVNTSSVTLAINDTTLSSQWEVAVVPFGTLLENISSFATYSSDTITVSSLLPGERYEAHVRSLCGGESSRFTTSPIFKTLCSPISTLPFLDSFETFGSTEEMTCYDIIGDYVYGTYPSITINHNEDYVSTGIQSLYISGHTSDIYLVLPSFEADLDTLSLEFMYRDGGVGSDYGNLQLGVIPSSLDTANFILLKTYDKVDKSIVHEILDLVSAGISTNDYRIAFRYKVGGGYSGYGVCIDDIKVSYAAACLPPSQVNIIDVHQTTADIRISDNSTNTKWEVLYGHADSALSALSSMIVYADSIRLTNLSPATPYQVYVRAIAGENVSRLTSPLFFTTECPLYTLPYTLNYENMNSLRDISCSDFVGLNTSGMYSSVEISDEYGFVLNGEQSLLFISGYGASVYYVLPEFDAPIDTLSMSFNYINESTSSSSSHFELGLIPLSLNASEFISLQTYPKRTNSTTANYEFLTSGYTGRDYRIAIRQVGGTSNGYYSSLDNINVEYRMPCFGPEKIEYISSTENTATIAIIDNVSNSTWEIAYGELNAEFDALTIVETNNDTIILSSLHHSTQYQVYARAKCATLSSEWTTADTLSTECAPIEITSVNSYVEDFNSYEDAQVPLCWRLIADIDSYPSVRILNSDTVLMFSDRDQAIVLPLFSTQLNSTYLDIDAQYLGLNANAELLIAYTNDVSNFSELQYVYQLTLNNEGFQHYNIDLTVLPDTAQYIVLLSKNGDIIIDNVSVELAPECYIPNAIEVTNILSNSAEIIYKVSPNHSNTEYKVLKNGEDIFSSWTDSRHIHIENLEPKSQYGIVLRAACLDGENRDTTAYSDTIFFSTMQSVATLPYVGNFEDSEDIQMWETVGDGNNQWLIASSDSNAVYQGDASLFVSSDTASHNYDIHSISTSWMYRTFFLEKGIYSLSYLYRSMGSESDYMRSFIAPANLDFEDITVFHSDLIAADNNKNIYGSNTWMDLSRDIIISSSGYYNLAFYWYNNHIGGVQSPAAVDNILLSQYSCAPMLAPKVMNTGYREATILLNDYSISSDKYQIVISDTDTIDLFSDELKITLEIDANSDTITLQSLTPATTYHVYARSLCSDGDTGKWSPSMHFTTQCEPDTIDEYHIFLEGFETYANEKSIDRCWSQFKEAGSNEFVANNMFDSFNRTPRSGKTNATLRSNSNTTLSREVYLFQDKEYTFVAYARQDNVDSSLASVSLSISGVEIASTELSNRDYTLVSGTYTPTQDAIHTIEIESNIRSTANYVSLDDIMVYMHLCDEPSFLEVNDISHNQASIEWSSTADSVNVVVSSINYRLDTTLVCEGGNMSLKLDDLSELTSYDVSITNICTPYRSFSRTISFSTICAPLQLPYVEDFQFSEVGELLSCWGNTKGTTTHVPYRWSVQVDMDTPSNKAMRFDSNNNAEGNSNILTSPSFAVSREGYILSFDYKNVNGGALNAYLSTDGGNTYSDTIINSVTGASNWLNVSADLSHYVGSNVTLVVSSVSNFTNNAYHYIDNFEISCLGSDTYYYDTICAASPYVGYGFHLTSEETKNNSHIEVSRLQKSTSPYECDTNIILKLHVTPTYNLTIQDKFCEGTTYNKGLFTNIKVAGTYVKSFVSSTGCDSTVTLHLSYLVLDKHIDTTICEGMQVSFHGRVLTSTGKYTHTIETANGCDSVITLNLRVRRKYFETDSIVCEGSVVNFEGKLFSTTGRHEVRYLNNLGCDSIRVLNLVVNPSNVIIDTTICQGQSLLFNGEYRTETNVYVHRVISSTTGCDSTTTLNLTVAPRDTIYHSDYVCEGAEYNANGFIGITTQSDTVLYKVEQDSNLCESVIRLNLRLSPTQEIYDTVAVNENQTYSFGGTDLSTAGDYSHKFTNNDGCDSIVYLHFIVNLGTPNTNIAGENNSLIVYPNPVNPGDAITIRSSLLCSEESIALELLDATGRIVRRETYQSAHNQIVILSPEVNGLYYIRVATSNHTVLIGKLIVK